MADGDNERYGVLCFQVDVHHHGFGSVNGDIVDEGPPLQLVDGVLKIAGQGWGCSPQQQWRRRRRSFSGGLYQ